MRELFGIYKFNAKSGYRNHAEKYRINETPRSLDDMVADYAIKGSAYGKKFIAYFLIMVILSLTGVILFAIVASDEKMVESFGILIGSFVWTIPFIIILHRLNKKKRVLVDVDLAPLKRDIENKVKECYGIQDEAKTVELFIPPIRMKKGNEQANFSYVGGNAQVFVYAKQDMLCISDWSFEFGIPISLLKECKIETQKIFFNTWLKKEKINSEKYKQYKIRYQNTQYSVKQMGTLIFEDDEGEFALRFMPYDFGDVKHVVNELKRKNGVI
ncbi:MAG: hypothetical protein LBQ27_05345 [Clostridiales bacterium]|jgi:hypothetical protein|nr:hypothetical protein [Clostridiales bacterium]